jgi:hypothetical protein
MLMRFLFVLIALAGAACNKSSNDTVVTPQPDAVLEVTVRDGYMVNQTANDSLLPNATVTLYVNEDDLVNHENVVRSGVTDSTGLVTFTQLNEASHYLYVERSGYGSSQQQVNTPQHSNTKLTVLL